jgi:hypothetical protein
MKPEQPAALAAYRYRGAVIDCLKGRYVCRLATEARPLYGFSFGVVGTITLLVDG